MEIIYGGGVCTPLGFSASAVVADIKGKKKGNKDLALILSDLPCNLGASFTKNRFCAAPVKYCRELLTVDRKYNGIIVNSGNANACTGLQGIEDCRAICTDIAEKLDVEPESLMIMSTGVIGVRLPVQRFLDNSQELVDELDSENGDDFAKAIMTTDTVSKELAVLVPDGNGGAYVVGGAAKGAGMIAPDMATMLGFVTTDALVDSKTLQEVVNKAVGGSFNSITVDGDMSTNDSVYLLANGMSGIKPDLEQFQEAVDFVCRELAKMIVRDGEGATKFVTVKVKGAVSEEDASKAAFKIANSPLVKTMFAGCDPNWGRLIATVGSAMIEADEDKIDIYIGDLHYAEKGVIKDPKLEDKAFEIMKKPEFDIVIDLNMGLAEKTVYTCDLTAEYVRINAEYRT